MMHRTGSKAVGHFEEKERGDKITVLIFGGFKTYACLHHHYIESLYTTFILENIEVSVSLGIHIISFVAGTILHTV